MFNASQTVKIEFGLALIQILDFDETNQVLTSNVWKRYVSWVRGVLGRWEFASMSGIMVWGVIHTAYRGWVWL